MTGIKVTLLNGLELEELEGDELDEVQKYEMFPIINKMYINRKKNYTVMQEFIDFEERFYNFDFRKSDVFVVGYPRSGTTWLQNIVWNILKNSNSDHPSATKNPLYRAPWFETDAYSFDNRKIIIKDMANYLGEDVTESAVDLFPKFEDPRIFKCHLFYSLCNKNILDISKVVFIIRNPLDVFISLFEVLQLFKAPGADETKFNITDMKNWFVNGKNIRGSPSTYFQDWLQVGNHPNFHLITYENLQNDTIKEIKALSDFLGKFLNDQQTQNVFKNTSFQQMKKEFESSESEGFKEYYREDEYKKKDSGFVRKGEIGDSKHLPKDIFNELSEYFKNTYPTEGNSYEFNCI